MKRFGKHFIILLLLLLCPVLYDCAGKPASESTAEPTKEQTAPETTEAPTKEQTAPETAEAPSSEEASVPESSAEPSSEEQDDNAYAAGLFDTSYVHEIDIRISGEDWDALLADPAKKKKLKVDAVIDGEEIREVSFATKGNSSLIFVTADPDSDRYSFRLNFGKYVKGQTYHGLDKLSLNNSFCDASYLKDFLSYELFRQAGVPAPLTSFVWLSVNGEARGLYLAVEDEDKSFLERTYGGSGVIYKPESSGLGLTPDMVDDIKENGLPMPTENNGADLVYRDDDPKTYPDIFENAETKSTEQDELAVIAAMKCLAEGGDLGSCLDTGELIRFFTAHNFLLNYDSYTGPMLHNLVIVEIGGRLSAVPWDYNLCFGTFVPGVGLSVLDDVTDLLNRGIDSPLVNTAEDERPLWKWIAEDDDHLNEYHKALDALLTACFGSGEFGREYDALCEMLLPYAEKDPTAFYSAEEFKTACTALKQFFERRAESIRLQLDGKLSPISAEQADADKVDASDLDIRDIGAFTIGPREEN